MPRERVKRTDCPNCGRSLLAEDKYCPSCGQENHTHKLPVRHFLLELVKGLFNFDTKLLRTLRDLFWPPEMVIRNFNANQRARYVHPLRLYLFTSVLFFILLAWTTEKLDIGKGDIVAVEQPSEEGNVRGLSLDFGEGEELGDSVLTALSRHPHLTDATIDSALVAADIDPGFWARVAVRLGMNASASSDRKAAYVQNIFSMFSKLMFILLPLFALLLYLLHLGSGRYFTEHLVFALYFHAVMYLLFGLRLFLGQMIESLTLIGTPLVLGLIYLFWSMQTVYQRSWWVTLLKGGFLIFFYTLFLFSGFLAAAVIGAL